METVRKIQTLRKNANEIYSLFLQKIPKWRKDPKNYDKTGWKFNGDDRFNACKPASVAFSTFMGTYGDSSCYAQCSLDAELFQKHLIEYLNRNKEEVMLAIAKQIEEEAKGLKEKAENELKAQLDKLAELDKV